MATENFFTLVLPNITRFDPMNDPINKYYDNTLTDFDLIILKVINENTVLNANKITDIIMKIDSTVTLDKVKNSLKRHLSDYCEFRGAKSNGGYYLK